MFSSASKVKKSVIHTTLFTNTLCGGVDWMTNLVCSHIPPPVAYISAEKYMVELPKPHRFCPDGLAAAV